MKFSYKIALMLLMGFVLCASPAFAEKTYKWKLGHHRSPEADVHKDMLEFAENVKIATNGKLLITIMGGGQLGSWALAQERVAMGNFEMTIAPFATAVDKRLECAMLPAAIKDWESASKKYVVGSPFYELLSKWAMEQNLQTLAPYPFYLGGLGFTQEIENPEDPTVKRGIKIRIPEMVSFRLLVEGLGYIPTPIAMTDVFPALQTGVVDGVSGGGAETYWTSGMGDILKSYLPINTHFETWFLMVNPQKFAKLPKEYQEVLRTEAIKLQNKRLKDGPAETAQWEQTYRDKGIKVYEFTPEQIAAYQKIMRDASWDTIREIVGAEPFDEAVNLLQ